jgi:hypothetical protein
MKNVCERIIKRAIELKVNTSAVKRFSINKEGRIRLQIDGSLFFKGDLRLKKELCDASPVFNVPTSCVDAIGLIITKKFFPCFIEYLSKISEEEYNNKVLTGINNHFEAKIVEENIEFHFHVSALYDMMIEYLCL